MTDMWLCRDCADAPVEELEPLIGKGLTREPVPGGWSLGCPRCGRIVGYMSNKGELDIGIVE